MFEHGKRQSEKQLNLEAAFADLHNTWQNTGDFIQPGTLVIGAVGVGAITDSIDMLRKRIEEIREEND